jgi:hypothetical protein
VAFAFANHGYGELRSMIDTLNSFVPEQQIAAPTEAPISPPDTNPTTPAAKTG